MQQVIEVAQDIRQAVKGHRLDLVKAQIDCQKELVGVGEDFRNRVIIPFCREKGCTFISKHAPGDAGPTCSFEPNDVRKSVASVPNWITDTLNMEIDGKQFMIYVGDVTHRDLRESEA